MHDMNVRRLRTNGVINANTARLQLSRLKQGDVDFELYSTSWKCWHDDAHPGEDPMLRKAELFDGINRKLRDDRRVATPHVAPLHTRVIEMDNLGQFDGDEFATMIAKIERVEAKLREDADITSADKYAPFEIGQVGSDSNTGAMVPGGINAIAMQQQPFHAQPYQTAQPVTLFSDSFASNTSQTQYNLSEINAIQTATPANTTATLADLEKLHTQMDVAHNKQFTQLEIKVDKVASDTATSVREVTEMANQNNIQLQGFQSGIADLMKLSTDNANQQRETHAQMIRVQEDLQRLTNASAGRDAPRTGGGGWREKITFAGKCFNCGIKGHKAEDCDKKARRKMVNAIQAGELEVQE